MNAAPWLQLRGVSLALAQFTLEVDLVIHGRVTGVFGASGAGKTSLLDLIAGLRRPGCARIQLGGRTLADPAAGIFVRPEHRRVGYVPQDGALFPHLDVRGNLLYGQRAAGSDPRLTLEAVAEVLEIGALLGRRHVAELSGGERQRVALGRALLASPEALLLDEPLAALDAGLKERILPYLFRVRDEFALPMLLVTHAPAEVMALCDEAVVLERGKIVAQGTPAELFEASPAVRYTLRSPAVLGAYKRPTL